MHMNKKYKDTLFRMVFREPEELLNLYNGMNGTGLSEPGGTDDYHVKGRHLYRNEE